MRLTRSATVPLIIAASSAPWFLVQPAFAAAPTAIISVSPASGQEPMPNNFPVDITVNTGGQGVTAVEIYLTIPTGLQYANFDASTSKFDTSVTSPTVSGNRLHFDRALITAGGFNGTGEVIRLFFTPLAAGSNALNIDQAASKVIAYSDSTNILQSVNNAIYSVPAPTVATTPISAVPVTSMPVTGTSPLLLLLPFLPFTLYLALRLRSYLGR